MTKYVAFLRGINVGGKKLIKMEDLSRLFESLGFKNVKTFIQSGNVIFETPQSDSNAVTKRIAKELQKALGYEVAVLLRTIPEIQDMVRRNPFKTIKTDGNVKMYVTFLAQEPKSKPKLPLMSANKDVEVFQIKNRDAFALSRMVNGRFSFPNNFIEKELGVPATTRNWTTVSKLIT